VSAFSYRGVAVGAKAGGEAPEPLAVLLLPSKLEEFKLAEHARDLLSIPRALALEPSRFKAPRFMRESIPARTARRLRFPGEPRMLILYHPSQYPLARALCARYASAELWYVRPDPEEFLGADAADDPSEFDHLGAERAGVAHVLSQTAPPAELREALRLRMRELDIISARPFMPWGRIQAR
jgi:hypothetical protein